MTKNKCIEKVIFMGIANVAYAFFLSALLRFEHTFNEIAFALIFISACALFGLMLGKLAFHVWVLRQYKDN